MNEYISMVVTFAGGVALFLLGMKLLTDGLKVAAGDSLRNLLAKWTSTMTKGILTGVLVTALVQSSSAVIFATIGFVNAGLMSLLQAVYVIFGSNVGTTLTGWIIAGIGLQVNLHLLAMPLLAIGIGLWFSSGGSRRGAMGQALVGFAVFFLGIDILKTTFEGLGELVPLDRIGSGWQARLLMVFAGIVLTTVMQSSSASIAIVITAAAGGVVPLYAAAAMVIGADIGTTSTAVLASIGSTPNAKRTATAHVLFNLVNGIVVLLMLGWYLDLIHLIFGAGMQVAIVVALFHTMKKLTGLVIMLPMTGYLVSWLEKRYVLPESDKHLPRYLDDTVLHTPSLAVSALVFELKRVGRKSRKLVRRVIRREKPAHELAEFQLTVEELSLHVADFIQKMQRLGFPPNMEYALPQSLRVLQYFREAAEHGIEAARIGRPGPVPGNITDTIDKYEEMLVRFSRIVDSEKEGFSVEEVNRMHADLESMYDHAKSSILQAASRGEIPVARMMSLHELIRNYRRIIDQLAKAAVFMDDFNELIEHEPGTGPQLMEAESESESESEGEDAGIHSAASTL